MPMWLNFPGVREVRVLYNVESDEGAPLLAMVLSTLYDNREALAAALASPVRFESRDMTKGLLEMFDGPFNHHVFYMTSVATIAGLARSRTATWNASVPTAA